MVRFTSPVRILATRNTARPFLLTASNSGGHVSGGSWTVADRRWFFLLLAVVERLAFACARAMANAEGSLRVITISAKRKQRIYPVLNVMTQKKYDRFAW